MIGLLEIRRRKVQFSLIALVVTLISYLVLMINGLGVGLNQLAGSALRNFDADAIAYSDESGLSVIRSELSDETVVAITERPGVEASARIGYTAANYRGRDGQVASAAFMGFDPGTIGEPEILKGRALAPEDSDGMLADRGFLDREGFEVGDSVDVTIRLSSQTFVIVGEVDQGSFFFQPAVYILRSTWREMKYGELPDVPAASIVLVRGSDLAGADGPGFEIVAKSTAFANIEGVAGQQSTVMALRFFGYLIGGLVIGVFFYVLTLQKVPQIGVLKAVGAGNFFVFRQVLTQVIVLAVVGLAISIPLAFLTERSLEQLPDPVPIAFTLNTFVTTAIALLVTAMLGAVFSARQVFRVDPIIALGQQQ